ncbi:MAG: helix-turn-helix domain-containing protein [Burkholderiales bacterium]|nr:helix-turn-helix domain-containing protein [Burkholderiales bacterium]
MLVSQKLSQREIAAQMGRSTSTISRELARNGHPQRGLSGRLRPAGSQSAPGAGQGRRAQVGCPIRHLAGQVRAPRTPAPCHPNRSQADSSACTLKT